MQSVLKHLRLFCCWCVTCSHLLAIDSHKCQPVGIGTYFICMRKMGDKHAMNCKNGEQVLRFSHDRQHYQGTTNKTSPHFFRCGPLFFRHIICGNTTRISRHQQVDGRSTSQILGVIEGPCPCLLRTSYDSFCSITISNTSRKLGSSTHQYLVSLIASVPREQVMKYIRQHILIPTKELGGPIRQPAQSTDCLVLKWHYFSKLL